MRKKSGKDAKHAEVMSVNTATDIVRVDIAELRGLLKQIRMQLTAVKLWQHERSSIESRLWM